MSARRTFRARRPAAPPPLRQRFRDAARESILDAAEQVFVRHGVSRGRMEQIASAAGVSVGTLYNHFRDRQALLDALVASRRTRLLAAADTALEAPAPDFSGRVRSFVGAMLDHVRTHRGLVALMVHERMAGHDTPGPPSVSEIGHRAEALMRTGLHSGVLRAGSARDLAAALMAVVQAKVRLGLAAGSRANTARDARWITELFLRGAARR